MKNKLLITISHLSLVSILGIQNGQAMNNPADIQDGYYRIRCQVKNNLPRDLHGSLASNDSDNWVCFLNNNVNDEYVEGGSQRKNIIWHVKKENGGYTLKNLKKTTNKWSDGLLVTAPGQASNAGFFPTILRGGNTDPYLPMGTERKKVLWDITASTVIPTERNTYKIKSKYLSTVRDGNAGCLSASENRNYTEVLASSSNGYHKEDYFVNIEDIEPGRSRKRILWQFSPISDMEKDALFPASSASIVFAEKNNQIIIEIKK